MRTLIGLLIMIAFLTSCNKSKTADDSEKVQKTTEDIFKSSNPNAKDVNWEKEGEFTEVEFIENGVEKSILYDTDGNVVENETEINFDQLPEAILSYLGENYPGAEIEEAEKLENTEGSFFVVEIENQDDEEIELLFDAEGTFINEVIEVDEDEDGEDDDEGDENELEIDPADLPETVLEYISQNYSDFIITEAEKETTEEGTFYEVELTDPDDEEIDLIFDENGNFIGIEDED